MTDNEIALAILARDGRRIDPRVVEKLRRQHGVCAGIACGGCPFRGDLPCSSETVLRVLDILEGHGIGRKNPVRFLLTNIKKCGTLPSRWMKQRRDEKARDAANRKIPLDIDLGPLTDSGLSVCKDIATTSL